MDKPPLILANQVIQQIVNHLFSNDIVVEVWDYIAIRLVFRKSGGSWQKFLNGDPLEVDRLSQVIVAWGKSPNRRFKSQEVI